MFRRLRMSQLFGIPLLALLLITGCAPVIVPVSVSTGVPTAGAATTVPLPVWTDAAIPTTRPATPTSAPEGTATPATSSTAHIAVQALDKSVKSVGLDGQSALLAASGVPFELGRPENAIAGTVYAVSQGTNRGVYAIDAKGARRLDFIPASVYGFAVNTHGTPLLAWGLGTLGPTSYGEIAMSAPDGSNRQSRLKETFVGEPRILLPLQFSADGKSLYLGKEPAGLGGYILFGGLSNVWSLSLPDGQLSERISEKLAGAFACIDGLSGPLVATHCDRKSIQIFDLTKAGQSARVIRPPAGLTFGQIGSAVFNPTGTRVAYAVARGNMTNEHGWLLVSDGLSGDSKVISESQPNEYFNVLAWLDADTVVVQSLSTPTSAAVGAVWLASANGGGLTKLADGTFLAILPRVQQ